MSEQRQCRQLGCTKATRTGKAYCPDHVERHWYVQTILAKIANMDDSADKIEKFGTRAVDLKSPLVGEVLGRLASEPHFGFASVARLTREVRRSSSVVNKILYVLKRRGRVKLAQNKRGSLTVELVETNGV